MTAVKMRKGGFITHVYNDPETIADAEKKGFSLVGVTDSDAEPARYGETPGGGTAESSDGLNQREGAEPAPKRVRKGRA